MENIILNGERERLFPRTIYKQCYWMVKDYERLKMLAELYDRTGEAAGDAYLFYADDQSGFIRQSVVSDAKLKYDAIVSSLEVVPEDLRPFFIGTFVSGVDSVDLASPNTWKKWRRIYIRELANKLNLY